MRLDCKDDIVREDDDDYDDHDYKSDNEMFNVILMFNRF